MNKVKINMIDDVADTLFIPLFMKALDAQKKRPVLNDKQSLELIQSIDYPFERYSKNNLSSLIGTCVRSKYMDEQTEQYISSHRNTVIVNIGCGLDLRNKRIKNSDKAHIYQLDLSEVIELRRKFLPNESADSLISSSAFDTQWMDNLVEKHPQSLFLFVIEGVLLYFEEEKVKELLYNLAERFTNSTIIFDGITTFISKRSDKHDTVKRARAKFNWGFDDNNIFEKWHPAMKTENIFYIGKAMKKYHWLFKIASLSSVFSKGSKIITLTINNNNNIP